MHDDDPLYAVPPANPTRWGYAVYALTLFLHIGWGVAVGSLGLLWSALHGTRPALSAPMQAYLSNPLRGIELLVWLVLLAILVWRRRELQATHGLALVSGCCWLLALWVIGQMVRI